MTFSLTDKHLMVNYHYVEDPRPDFTGIHPCTLAEFERQIDLLSRHFVSGTVGEVFEAAKREDQKPRCAITLDDGLKDQFENAVPVLKRYGFTATFFPIVSTFDGILPSAQMLHILLSRLSAETLINRFNTFSLTWGGQTVYHAIPKDRRLDPNRRLHEDIPTANFKETVMALPHEVKTLFLASLRNELGIDERAIIAQIFMTPDNLRSLARDGFAVENHSYLHSLFDTPDRTFLANDIRMAQESLHGILGARPTVFSYPHGRISQTGSDVIAATDLRYAVTTERRVIRADDDPYHIPRFDAMDLKEVHAS